MSTVPMTGLFQTFTIIGSKVRIVMFRPTWRVRVVDESNGLLTTVVVLLLAAVCILLLCLGVDWVLAGYAAKATWVHLRWSVLLTAIMGWLVYRLMLAIAGALTSPPHV
jgi:hypothetical protein